MIRRMQNRALVLLLATLFVLGSIGLPGLDAAVYHRGAPRTEATTRFQETGAPLPHTLQCVVGRHVAGRALLPSFAPAVHTEPAVVLWRERVVLVLRTHSLSTPKQPRAPPAPSV
jgi:hypothetical protein